MLTGGAGGRAMAYAAERVFGKSTPFAFSLNGRTDGWIIAQLAAGHELADDPDTLTRFRNAYLDHLAREIERPGPRKGVMPGARLKLEHFDLWKYFTAGAFGGDTVDRNSLLSVALNRVEELHGARFESSDVVIVGDTPFDVAVARTGGVRSVAVATGSHDVGVLTASGADVVLEDLSDLNATLAAFGL